MLILSRKLDESIVIGEGADRVEITVIKLSPRRVTLRIHAPPWKKVLRGELEPHAISADASPDENPSTT